MSIRRKDIAQIVLFTGALIGLAIFTLSTNVEKQLNAKKLQPLTNLASETALALHASQQERSLAISYLTTNSHNQLASLQNQRQTTERQIAAMMANAELLNRKSYSPQLFQSIQAAENLAEHHINISSKIESSQTNPIALNNYYAKLNQALIDVIAQISQNVKDQDIHRKFFAFTNFLQGKEAVGIEQTLVASLNNSSNRQQLLQQFIATKTQQQSAFKQFSQLASSKNANAYQALSTEPTFKTTEQLYHQAVTATALTGNININQWADQLNNKINQLHAVELLLKTDISNQVNLLSRANIWKNGILLAIFSYLFISIAIGVYFLFFKQQQDINSLYQQLKSLASQDNVLGTLNAEAGEKSDMHRNLNDFLAKVSDETEKLQNLANIDQLTRVYNRRGYYELTQEALKQSKQQQRPMSILMLDADHFKHINDTYGHAAGDEVLQQIAQICEQGLRKTDVLGRLGGEEFAITLTNTDLRRAVDTAERIRATIQRQAIVLQSGEILHITISIGVIAREQHHHDLNTIIDLADKALYRAKQAGRNRVYAHSLRNPVNLQAVTSENYGRDSDLKLGTDDD